MLDDLPTSTLEQARMVENLLVAACEGQASANNLAYTTLRRMLLNEPIVEVLPSFVRTCRDIASFWAYIKGVSPQWAPRRAHVRDAFTPLFDHLENTHKRPADDEVSDALRSFDPEGVHSVWDKALKRRHTDAEGAITSARTLLETVCKRIMDEAGKSDEYTEKDDLPNLYRKVGTLLNIAPSQHTEDVFKRILGGCTSVVEGLGALRNKISDAHGRGGKPIKPSPRHAQLAVNLAGSMAMFIVETWQARNEP